MSWGGGGGFWAASIGFRPLLAGSTAVSVGDKVGNPKTSPRRRAGAGRKATAAPRLASPPSALCAAAAATRPNRTGRRVGGMREAAVVVGLCLLDGLLGPQIGLS